MKFLNIKFAGRLIKIAILLLTLVFIYIELFHRRSISELIPQFIRNIRSGSLILWFVLALMPVNWALESVKWRFLLKRFHRVSFLRSVQAIMTGVSVSFFTPNRVGEFGGRILYLPPEKRVQGVTASIVGSISQLSVTLLMGILGLMVFVLKDMALDPVLERTVLSLSVLSFVLILVLYFKSTLVFRWLGNWKLPGILHRFFLSCSTYTFRELLTALAWSGLRYAVFCFQMGLVIYAVVDFTTAPGYTELLYAIPLYFFIISVIPTIGFSEVGTRGLILAQIMNDYATEPDLLLAGTILWIINVILPALIGTITVWRVKIALRK